MNDDRASVVVDRRDCVSVVVDSRDRDRAAFPDAHSYTVPLTDAVRDVVSLELRHAIYSPSGEHAFLIVEEARPRQVASNHHVAGACAMLGTDASNHRAFASFETPVTVPRVAKLTVRIVGFDGSPLDLGEHVLRFDLRTHRSIDVAADEGWAARWARELLRLPDAFTKSELNRAFYAARDGTDAPKRAYRVLRPMCAT